MWELKRISSNCQHDTIHRQVVCDYIVCELIDAITDLVQLEKGAPDGLERSYQKFNKPVAQLTSVKLPDRDQVVLFRFCLLQASKRSYTGMNWIDPVAKACCCRARASVHEKLMTKETWTNEQVQKVQKTPISARPPRVASAASHDWTWYRTIRTRRNYQGGSGVSEEDGSWPLSRFSCDSRELYPLFWLTATRKMRMYEDLL